MNTTDGRLPDEVKFMVSHFAIPPGEAAKNSVKAVVAKPVDVAKEGTQISPQRMKQIKDIFWTVLIIGVFGTLIYKFAKRAMTDHWLKTDAVRTKAVIIDEKVYQTNSHIIRDWSYAYEFVVNRKSYTNNAHDPELRVGDTVEIEYVKDWPSLNRPLHLND